MQQQEPEPQRTLKSSTQCPVPSTQKKQLQEPEPQRAQRTRRNNGKAWRIAIALGLLVGSVAAQVTKGTAISVIKDPAGTSVTTASTFSAGANALITCGVTYDDNGANTQVSSISISGSPTYAIAWQQIATNGRVFLANSLGTEMWMSVASTAISNQAVTVTISSSERFTVACQSFTGIDTANPIPASASASASTVTVTSSGNDNSLYAGTIGCASNSAATIAAGSGYTMDASPNYGAGTNKWVHGSWETKNAAVTPPANTTVNATVSTCTGTGSTIQTIGVEIKKAGAGGASSYPGWYGDSGWK
jgi:hypothetical protein